MATTNAASNSRSEWQSKLKVQRHARENLPVPPGSPGDVVAEAIALRVSVRGSSPADMWLDG
jgi:hypothetical protein